MLPASHNRVCNSPRFRSRRHGMGRAKRALYLTCLLALRTCNLLASALSSYDTAADYGEGQQPTYDQASYNGAQGGASLYDTANNNNNVYDTATQGTLANGKDYHDAERFEGDYGDGGGRAAKADGYLMVGTTAPAASVYDMADNAPQVQSNYDIASGAPQMSAYDVAAQSNPAVYDTATNAPPAAGFGRNKKGSLRIHKYDQYDTAKC